MPVAARKSQKTTIVEHAHYLGHSAELREQRLEHKPKPLLNG